MTTTRRQKLEAMLQEDPDDHTLRYMLAMELQKEGDHEQSLKLFAELMQSEPPHVPAFLMAGQQLTGLGRKDEARETYQAGIRHAQAQGNDHAAGEMTQFLAEL